MTTSKMNDQLTRVGPGTPMGRLLREYWMPVMRSGRLTEPGGAPMAVELLGEKFIVFRADDGTLGCFAEACPHRGASLTLARNEDCALRCIYHGWKFSVTGQVLETPSEPAELTRFASRVKLRHHPVIESGGVIWVWIGGTGRSAPAPPAFTFTKLPPEQVFGLVAMVECNWLQGVEADIDSAHVSLLHETEARAGALRDLLDDRTPRDEIDEQPYGLRFGSVRTLSSGAELVRVKPFAMPWYTVVPELPSGDRLWHAWVPINDHRTIMWYLWYNEERPVDPAVFADQFGLNLDTMNPDNIREGFTRENNWGQDRRQMRENQSFSGIRGLVLQDIAVQESMGPIVDRTGENPGRSDTAIVATRRYLLDAIKRHERGETPPGLGPEADYDRVRSAEITLAPGVDWRSA
ncbi:Rieske 2Fe-2S domain-containing protein [Salinispora arenicola]|uniref:Rieske 2Fe-2S domain-containing protein n=1 Tax=Salinispora arenicola TaxID=168697 RepID=UPI00207AA220|nr:Rieske 2Fe-2S domain-containing protein [Salinispora arenicola]MCN0177301.1 Rieske 2Fe-2S domain-containing protein [Salinispora arenicola]